MTATTWRDRVPQPVLGEMDGVFARIMPYAEELLRQFGEIYPFGMRMSEAGEFAPVFAGPDIPQDAPADVVLARLHDVAASLAEDTRAVAFVVQVRIPQLPASDRGNAVRVEIHHREPYSIGVIVPYERHPETRELVMRPEDMYAYPESRRVWGEAGAAEPD